MRCHLIALLNSEKERREGALHTEIVAQDDSAGMSVCQIACLNPNKQRHIE